MLSTEVIHMISAYSIHPPDSWYESRSLPTSWKLIQGRLIGKKILDIGALSGWISWYARKEGTEVISSDIFANNMHPSLIRIICDKEHIPFKEQSFDFVLTANVLHHGDLNKTIKEIYRILKLSGELISLQEPCISNEENELDCLNRYCKEELNLGIDERRPSLDKYKSALSIFKNVYIYIMSEQIFDHIKQQSFEILTQNSYEGGIAIRSIK